MVDELDYRQGAEFLAIGGVNLPMRTEKEFVKVGRPVVDCSLKAVTGIRDHAHWTHR